MPTFTFDVSEEAAAYARASTAGKAGNAGQETLVADLDIDCSAEIEVYIAGDDVETTAEGFININSSHPEAISEIISDAEDAFEEFLGRLSTTSFEAYAGADLIETIRQTYVDEAFKDLGS
jgi:NADPH-dependent curcumin reductase CurA